MPSFASTLSPNWSLARNGLTLTGSLDCYALMIFFICLVSSRLQCPPLVPSKRQKHLFKNTGYYHHKVNDRIGVNGRFWTIIWSHHTGRLFCLSGMTEKCPPEDGRLSSREPRREFSGLSVRSSGGHFLNSRNQQIVMHENRTEIVKKKQVPGKKPRNSALREPAGKVPGKGRMSHAPHPNQTKCV